MELIKGGKEDFSIDQELEALDEQTARMLKFRNMSERERQLLYKSWTIEEAIENIHETLYWITERYC